MVSRASQGTGFSRKQALTAFLQPATAVAWSGAKSWEASGEPAVPKWRQGHRGGRERGGGEGTDLLSKAPCCSSCNGNEGKTPPHPFPQ